MGIQLSIVIPIYNVSRYLEDCLNPLVGKGEESIEILLIDDGSTDASAGLADRFAGSYQNVTVYHRANGGLSDARNFGLRKAAGKYVFFLDADDFLREDSIDVLLSAIGGRELDILLWDADLYDENGRRAREDRGYFHHTGAVKNCVCTGRRIIEDQLAYKNDYAITVWLGLYNREFLIRNQFWFERGLLHEDELWTQKVLLEAARVVYTGEALYCYRLRKDSIMRSGNQDFRKPIASLIYIYTSLLAYYDWKVEDADFRKKLKGNTVKRYLHMIGTYPVSRYPELMKRIDQKALLRSASSKKDQLRALILMLSIRGYCGGTRLLRRNQRAERCIL